MDHAPGVWVRYPYCISIVVLTLRQQSKPVFVPAGASRVSPGIPYVLLSLFFGWWGCPFGLIFTPICIAQALGGGEVVG